MKTFDCTELYIYIYIYIYWRIKGVTHAIRVYLSVSIFILLFCWPSDLAGKNERLIFFIIKCLYLKT